MPKTRRRAALSHHLTALRPGLAAASRAVQPLRWNFPCYKDGISNDQEQLVASLPLKRAQVISIPLLVAPRPNQPHNNVMTRSARSGVWSTGGSDLGRRVFTQKLCMRGKMWTRQTELGGKRRYWSGWQRFSRDRAKSVPPASNMHPAGAPKTVGDCARQTQQGDMVRALQVDPQETITNIHIK